MLVKNFDKKYLGDFDKKEFENIYKSAYGVLFKKTSENNNEAEYVNELYLKLLLNTYNNKEDLRFIKKSNDYLNISPVYTWLKLNEDELKGYYEKNQIEKKLDNTENSLLRTTIGAFWGYVMMYDKKNNISIRWGKKYQKNLKKKHNIKRRNDNDNYAWGFKTATLYV